MRASTRLAALALAGALTLAGCTSSADDEPGAGSAGPGAEQDADPPADGDAQPTGVIGVDFPDPDDVIADATFAAPGTQDDVRVGIESLTVRGDFIELRLVFTPLYGDEPVSVFSMLGESSNIDLIDRANLKEYREGYGTDPVDARAAQGESVGYQVFYAAPEDDIDVVDVKVHDSWPVFEDVPLTSED